MAVNRWKIEFDDLEQLVEKMKRIPNQSEKTINDVIHKKGVERVETSIRAYIPVSTLDGAVRPKRHARDIKYPTKPELLNLAFIVRPKKPRFEYLKYPDLAIGQSKNNPPRDFMAKGLNTAAPKIVEDMSLALEDVINRTLGGN